MNAECHPPTKFIAMTVIATTPPGKSHWHGIAPAPILAPAKPKLDISGDWPVMTDCGAEVLRPV